jgi:predicted transposase/invertase (TIGR01784 family)
MEGIMEGKMEGRIEVARKMKSKGLSPFEIAELTGLSENEINKL